MAVRSAMTNETYFQLEGEFLGVCALDGYKLKYLRLRTADRDVIVKVPKELRLGMVYQLAIGERIRCEGIQKDWKFKASVIAKVDSVASPANESKVKILICQKSHCYNNGGKEIYSALAEQLNSHDLNDSVTLKSTGCLKCCKQAPNLVVLPVGKTANDAASPLEHRWRSLSYGESSYRNVSISQIPAIISKVHYHLSIEPK